MVEEAPYDSHWVIILVGVAAGRGEERGWTPRAPYHKCLHQLVGARQGISPFPWLVVVLQMACHRSPLVRQIQGAGIRLGVGQREVYR